MSLGGALGQGYTWTHGNIKLIGYSLAGVSTSIAFPDADVCFDVAQGLPFQIPITNLLITHGHMDHAHGLPYVIGQKSMTRQAVPQVYMPSSLVNPMKGILKAWEKVEDHTYNCNLIPIQFDKEYPLKGGYFFKAFPTFHRVDSCGYTVFERRKKLRPDLADKSREELLALKSKGEDLETNVDTPLVSFTGDTKIEFLDSRPWIRQSKVLVMEATFVDEKKSVENARFWGHLHLDELLPQLEKIKSEKILLIHISARYTTPYIQEVLEARLPEHLKTKVAVFPRPL